MFGNLHVLASLSAMGAGPSEDLKGLGLTRETVTGGFLAGE